ncbi:hypothetical protein LCGC14_0557470 [marine sediment metagenome]|uniref:Uncharacterized protein n=1 Tax=marine sediment metagenome TaxID=412755 RepID=A0A0F9U9H5_9ZZZZ
MKVPGLIILASTSSVIGSDADRGFLLAVLGVGALVFYRLKRKFKKEPIKTWKAWLDRNIVELGLVSVIAPGSFRMILDLVKEVIGKL